MNTKGSLLVACAAFSLSACGTFQIQTPPRFLELEIDEDTPSYDYRATTADGVVLSVTEHEIDQERGSTVQFWVEAIEARLRLNGGYALIEKKDVTTTAGLKGTQLRFGRDEAQRPYRYWVTVFVAGDSVYVVEAGGEETVFTASADSLDKAIASFTP